MNKLFRLATGLSVGLALVAGASVASAQERSRIVAGPAVVQVASAAPAPAAVTPSSVIIITPTPRPPRPPNFCFRGNSAGVTRC